VIGANSVAKAKRMKVKAITEFVSIEERGRLWQASQGCIQVINTPRPRRGATAGQRSAPG
jgi:hypothetical protein